MTQEQGMVYIVIKTEVHTTTEVYRISVARETYENRFPTPEDRAISAIQKNVPIGRMEDRKIQFQILEGR